ncbi:unnamed protein product [Prunus armeniaca]|uniref:Uncharacterized protein n=1 Tax=Prunus armeniaca TaxID=36596 RepID=A0A6J5U6J0_PRUAR|nr:unnamed protein product [Prunus armeniaca]CAB4302208.1 unnamed protein product [Prunus armeniaca]
MSGLKLYGEALVGAEAHAERLVGRRRTGITNEYDDSFSLYRKAGPAAAAMVKRKEARNTRGTFVYSRALVPKIQALPQTERNK